MLFLPVTGTAAFLYCLASKRWFSGFSKSSHARFSHGVFFLDQHSWNCSFSLFWLLSGDVGRRSCRHGSLVISTGNGASTVTIHSFNFRRESNIRNTCCLRSRLLSNHTTWFTRDFLSGVCVPRFTHTVKLRCLFTATLKSWNF